MTSGTIPAGNICRASSYGLMLAVWSSASGFANRADLQSAWLMLSRSRIRGSVRGYHRGSNLCRFAEKVRYATVDAIS